MMTDTKVLPATASSRPKPPNAGKGRKKGVPNKSTTALKDAILLAATEVGYDGKGGDGLLGYLKRVAAEDVKAFTSLLGKVLPLQVTGEGGAPLIPPSLVVTIEK